MASGDASFEVLADVGSNLLVDKSLRLILVPTNFDQDKNRWNLCTGKFFHDSRQIVIVSTVPDLLLLS